MEEVIDLTLMKRRLVDPLKKFTVPREVGTTTKVNGFPGETVVSRETVS
jgi:hypothetical protein